MALPQTREEARSPLLNHVAHDVGEEAVLERSPSGKHISFSSFSVVLGMELRTGPLIHTPSPLLPLLHLGRGKRDQKNDCLGFTQAVALGYPSSQMPGPISAQEGQGICTSLAHPAFSVLLMKDGTANLFPRKCLDTNLCRCELESMFTPSHLWCAGSCSSYCHTASSHTLLWYAHTLVPQCPEHTLVFGCSCKALFQTPHRYTLGFTSSLALNNVPILNPLHTHYRL